MSQSIRQQLGKLKTRGQQIYNQYDELSPKWNDDTISTAIGMLSSLELSLSRLLGKFAEWQALINAIDDNADREKEQQLLDEWLEEDEYSYLIEDLSVSTAILKLFASRRDQPKQPQQQKQQKRQQQSRPTESLSNVPISDYQQQTNDYKSIENDSVKDGRKSGDPRRNDGGKYSDGKDPAAVERGQLDIPSGQTLDIPSGKQSLGALSDQQSLSTPSGQQRLGIFSGQQSTFTAVETIPKATCIIIGNGTQGNFREHVSALPSSYVLDSGREQSTCYCATTPAGGNGSQRQTRSVLPTHAQPETTVTQSQSTGESIRAAAGEWLVLRELENLIQLDKWWEPHKKKHGNTYLNKYQFEVG